MPNTDVTDQVLVDREVLTLARMVVSEQRRRAESLVSMRGELVELQRIEDGLREALA